MERPKVGVGVFVLKDGKVLMTKRKGAHGKGKWCPPGGHLEFNEEIFDAAFREVREETGMTIADPRFLCITNDMLKEENKHYITIFVTAEHGKGKAQNMEPDKCEEIGWFSFDSLPSPLFLPVESLIKGRCFPENAKNQLS